MFLRSFEIGVVLASCRSSQEPTTDPGRTVVSPSACGSTLNRQGIDTSGEGATRPGKFRGCARRAPSTSGV